MNNGFFILNEGCHGNKNTAFLQLAYHPIRQIKTGGFTSCMQFFCAEQPLKILEQSNKLFVRKNNATTKFPVLRKMTLKPKISSIHIKGKIF